MKSQTEEFEGIELEFREGTSDKVYRACIEAKGSGFVVNFGYGRRGATMNTGTKTSQPVTYAAAQEVYEKLVRSKLVKGYKPVGGLAAAGGSVGTLPPVGRVGVVVAESDRFDTGLRPQLLNPIAEEEAEAYLVSARWCVQEKHDGRRILVRKTGASIIAANRKGQRVGLTREVEAQLAALPGDFVLDGEMVGEVYHVFDLLENSDGDWRDMPYSARLLVLQCLIGGLGGNVLTSPTATGKNKEALFAHLKRANKEGVVFKNLDASWSEGRPSNGGTQLKCKFWASCSCIVRRVNAQRSVEVALEGQSMGSVTIPPNHAVPDVGEVVEVRYLYVNALGGSLYQPIYLGVRDDVRIEDCTIERQQIKYKSAAARAA